MKLFTSTGHTVVGGLRSSVLAARPPIITLRSQTTSAAARASHKHKSTNAAAKSSSLPPKDETASASSSISSIVSSNLASSSGSGPKPRVIYRGPPGMKPWLYYFVGSVFAGAGLSQGFLLSQHMNWPIWSTEGKLAPAYARYAAGGCLAMVAGGFGLIFFWTPSRLATRVTLYPATSQVGIRTAAPAVRAFLPRSMQSKKSAPISALDRYERLHNLDALFRKDRNSATQIQAYAEGRARRMVSNSKKGGIQRVPSAILLGEDVPLGYQLEAAPHTQAAVLQTTNLYQRGWYSFKNWLKGYTDWSLVAGQEGMSKQERKAKKSLDPKEPWFLDRGNFDHLFPMGKHKS